MAYSTSNPPGLIAQNVGGTRSLWMYVSADAEATFDDSGYITDAGNLGMKTGDIVLVVDTGNNLSSIAQVTVASGAGTLTALTAVTP